MPYYEIIFENGEYSIANYENDEEALTAIHTHHDRAAVGEKAGSWEGANPAQRVKAILVYDEHPGVDNPNLSVDQIKDVLDKFDEGSINIHELSAALRDEISPLVESEPHESNYKMKELRELEWQS